MTALRAARPDEAAALTELTMRSKAHWDYDDEFLAAVRDELTVRPFDCDGHVVVAERDDTLLGYYAITGTPPVGELDSLFVDPDAIGTGVGGLLLAAARHHAEDVPSGSIPGRTLPRLQLDL